MSLFGRLFGNRDEQDPDADSGPGGWRHATVLRGGRIRTPHGDVATMVVAGGRVAWLGDDFYPYELCERGTTATVVELRGALVTPAFVDAHVHTTGTGLMLTGLDLHGAPSLADALDRLAAHIRDTSADVVTGTGWDQTGWPEGRPPTGDELSRASGGRRVYLSRVDAHSAVCSPELLARTPAAAAAGYLGDGLVERDAHHVVRRHVYGDLPADVRREAQEAALRHAASLGIASVHEMSGPDIAGGEPDLRALLDLVAEGGYPEVVPYWGALHDVETAVRLGCRGAAGDLFADGSVGSRTAALREPYADARGTAGHAYLDAEEIAAHVVACTEAGLQAGFHAIGDAALVAVADGLRAAAAKLGAAAVRAARHRIEHAELLAPEVVATFAELGVVASVQPAFDAAWGGPDGMYAARLGRERAAAMNPLAGLHAAGVPLAFGSDAPVTPLDPWAGVRAAVAHTVGGQGVPLDVAFAAHTAGGRYAAGQDRAGELVVGAPATYAVWDTGDIPYETGSGLPDPAAGTPVCLETAVDGVPVHVKDDAPHRDRITARSRRR